MRLPHPASPQADAAYFALACLLLGATIGILVALHRG